MAAARKYQMVGDRVHSVSGLHFTFSVTVHVNVDDGDEDAGDKLRAML
jgi:hypothetical protein